MNIQPEVGFFLNPLNAADYQERFGGWLYQVKKGIFWFPSHLRPKEILQHPIIEGVEGQLLIHGVGGAVCL